MRSFRSLSERGVSQLLLLLPRTSRIFPRCCIKEKETDDEEEEVFFRISNTKTPVGPIIMSMFFVNR